MTVRRALMVAVPVLVAATIWSHPPDPVVPEDLADGTTHYISLHVVLLVLVPLLGLVVWWLLEDVPGPTATAARVLLLPAVAWYAAFDAVVGIGSGVLAREALAADNGVAEGAAALAARWMEIPFPLSLISGLGTAMWVLAVVSAGVALIRAGFHPLAGWALVVSAPLFGWGHPRITGVLAMVAMLTAVAARARLQAPATAGPA